MVQGMNREAEQKNLSGIHKLWWFEIALKEQEAG